MTVAEIYEALVAKLKEIADFGSRVYHTEFESQVGKVKAPFCIVTLRRVRHGEGGLGFDEVRPIFTVEVAKRGYMDKFTADLTALTGLVEAVKDKLAEDRILGGKCSDVAVMPGIEFSFSKEDSVIIQSAVLSIQAVYIET